jgi:hypothetical protein
MLSYLEYYADLYNIPKSRVRHVDFIFVSMQFQLIILVKKTFIAAVPVIGKNTVHHSG